MKAAVISYISSMVSLLVLDGIWLGVTGGPFYKKHLAHLWAPTFGWFSAALFYVFYPIGIMVLISLPALNQQLGYGRVFFMGAVLGFMAYGAYNFTNGATLKNWPVVVMVVDLTWGTLVTGTACCITVFALRRFL